jgi:peptidoglycan/xylan/chitin deacetylase (PgdA/CDA1 family)
MGRVDRFGPEQPQRAVVLTFDNLGEASALERGEQTAPTGDDPSVTQILPWLLDALDRHNLTATFFVEAINCELYPDAVREIAARGHELGHHGWSHEHWDQLSPDAEREALSRGVRAFEAIGVRPRGFRPPGGALTPRTPALLRELGLDWCSPAGGEARVQDGLAYVPFEWELVDAYHLMESFASLRRERGESEAPVPPPELASRLQDRLAAATGRDTLILHPFLMLDDAWAAGVSELLAAIERLDRGHRARVLPGGAFADWLRSEKPA